MLCQTFEKRCMYHYKMLSIFLGLKNERISIEDWVAGRVYWSPKDRKPTSKKTSLGVFTKNRKELFVNSNTLSDWVAELFEKAQDNRNWIVHESLVDLSFIISSDEVSKGMFKLEELKEKISPIIRALYVLGAIEIEQNDKTPFYDPEQEAEYTKLIIDWIFADRPHTHRYNVLHRADHIIFDRFIRQSKFNNEANES
ncbi:hypothetical protein SAMN05421747_10859 [Parapedobacter composti]|uniref:Uncharacterized protein n=2 Tax=Parapedobacter composti TaxID=623281 RepID=A0A1I1IBZ9_9SPHI|nr:hypothetical protein SAMN05421747_10859 [Parapedobacter composti]